MVAELLLHATLDDLGRRNAAVVHEVAARRLMVGPAPRTRAQVRQAAGAWCWLLDRLPAHSRRHASV